jgi:hypothetical protein
LYNISQNIYQYTFVFLTLSGYDYENNGYKIGKGVAKRMPARKTNQRKGGRHSRLEGTSMHQVD